MPFSVEAFQPAIVGLAADAVIPAGGRDTTADFLDVPQHRQLVLRAPLELPLGRCGDSFRHGIFL